MAASPLILSRQNGDAVRALESSLITPSAVVAVGRLHRCGWRHVCSPLLLLLQPVNTVGHWILVVGLLRWSVGWHMANQGLSSLR